MRYLRLQSDTNSTDFIELNDFNGFLCTQFQTLGISRSLEFLTIKNRNIVVGNKPNFKKYSLTIEILTPYAEYEIKYRQLLNFLDRNKRNGVRLYYKPYSGMDMRYCLCSVETSAKTEKRQPIILTLTQNSLWLSEEHFAETEAKANETSNMFIFADDESITNVEGGYYSAGFFADENGYFSIAFYNGVESIAIIENESYNEIPLKIIIKAPSVNPTISLFRLGEEKPIRETRVTATIETGYLEIDANIINSGVWYVDEDGKKEDYTASVNYELGSPYFFVDNGEYYIRVSDGGGNQALSRIIYQEEYSE